MYLKELRCWQDIAEIVTRTGVLPFFRCGIDGFSVEDACPPELWFADDRDGPWEWKGPVASSGVCVYGKFFNGKAGFISRELLPDFANYRRDGYDFDARCDDGLAPYKDKIIYEAAAREKRVLSKKLKYICNFGKGGYTGFDASVARLQAQLYLVISDFVYETDRHGKPYGWGIAEYSTPEELFGYEYVSSAYKRSPESSRIEIIARVSEKTGLDEKLIAELISYKM